MKVDMRWKRCGDVRREGWRCCGLVQEPEDCKDCLVPGSSELEKRGS